MDTPELKPLYRRYERYDRLAKQYNAVLDERAGGMVHVVTNPEQQTLGYTPRLGKHAVAIPKRIPRDRPTAWYVAKYVEYMRKAANAEEHYWALADDAKKQPWSALDRDGKLAQLRQIGDRLARITATIDTYRAEIPA